MLKERKQIIFSPSNIGVAQITLNPFKMSMRVNDCQEPREGFPRPFPNTPSNVLEQFQLAGKVVVVTGAADGIGYAVTEAMAEAKADVALWYNS